MDLSKYYEEICKQPMLSKEEEIALFKIFKSKKASDKQKRDAEEKLIKANLRFVFKMAKRYSRNDPSLFEDLISAGNEGLLVGLQKFKPQRKVRFLSYAGWWVTQRILKEMSKMRIVALPIWKQQLASKIMRVKNKSGDVTIRDIKKAFPDVPAKDLEELFQTRYLTYYIADMEEDNFQITPIESEVDTKIENKKLHDAVSSLPYPHNRVIAMTFGLEDGHEVKGPMICKLLHITRDQLKQYKKEGLDLLKNRSKFEKKEVEKSS